MQEEKLGPDLAPLASAASATRMFSSDDGAWVAAELGGRWLAEEFTQHQEAPPVLKLIAAQRDAVVATANGWMLGRPGQTGALYLATGDAELTYRLAWLVPPGAKSREPQALAAPSGLWAVKASFPLTADRAAIILWRPSSKAPWSDQAARREELWLATVDVSTGKLVAQATWTGLTPRMGGRTVQVGATGGAGGVYVIDQAGGGSRLVAFDPATLAEHPAVTLAPRAPVAGDGAIIGPSGDGAHVMVILGNSRDSGVATEAGLVLSATGRMTTALDSAKLGPAARVQAVGPGKGGEMVWATLLDTRGQGPDRLSLASIASFDPGKDSPTTLFDTSEAGHQSMREAAPIALALDPKSGRQWVALPFQSPDGTVKTGRERPEVDGLVETPGGWYQPGRPRIDEWLASQR
jgi:hypothetical protein